MSRSFKAIGTGLLLAALPAAAASATQYTVDWALQFGTAGEDLALSVKVDLLGNAYVGGYTSGVGGFLNKYDRNGNALWSQPLSGNAESVATNIRGDIFVGGSAGGDAFITKLDRWGNEAWTQQIGSTGLDVGFGVAADLYGNSFVTGRAMGGVGGNPGNGFIDGFLAKYDKNGNTLWSRQIGAVALDQAQSVATDLAGNVYVTGFSQGSLDGQTNNGLFDAFVSKYDASGNLAWTKLIGTTSLEQSYAIAVDWQGNAYISGDTSGAVGGPSNGGIDAFLAKFDTDGNTLWTEQLGTSGGDAVRSIALDLFGNPYVAGFTSGDLDGGGNAGNADLFFARYDQNGNLLVTEQLGSAELDAAWSIAVDVFGNPYVAGFTRGDLEGNTNLGSSDAFLIRFDKSSGTYSVFAVPEPGSVALIGLGLTTLLARRRRDVC